MGEKSFLSLPPPGCFLFFFFLWSQDCKLFSLMQPEDGPGVSGDKEKDEGRMKSVKVLRVYHLRLKFDIGSIRNPVLISFVV